MSKLEKARERLKLRANRGPGFSPYAARRLEELRLKESKLEEGDDESSR